MSEWLSTHSAPGYGSKYAVQLDRGYWGAHWRHLERPALLSALEQCRREGAERLLDLACGTGRILSVAEHVFPSPVGADASHAMLEQASVLGRRLVRCDAGALPFRQVFDVVTAFRFMLNASPALRQTTLESLRLVMRKDGWLISNVHVNASAPSGLAYRVYNKVVTRSQVSTLSVQQYTNILRDSGFVPERVIWLGALPRVMKQLDSLASRLLVPVERIAHAARVPEHWAQSFMVIARPA